MLSIFPFIIGSENGNVTRTCKVILQIVHQTDSKEKQFFLYERRILIGPKLVIGYFDLPPAAHIRDVKSWVWVSPVDNSMLSWIWRAIISRGTIN